MGKLIERHSDQRSLKKKQISLIAKYIKEIKAASNSLPPSNMQDEMSSLVNTALCSPANLVVAQPLDWRKNLEKATETLIIYQKNLTSLKLHFGATTHCVQQTEHKVVCWTDLERQGSKYLLLSGERSYHLWGELASSWIITCQGNQ